MHILYIESTASKQPTLFHVSLGFQTSAALILAGLKITFLNTDQIVLLYYFYLKFLRA